MQPFDHNGHGPKTGGGLCPLFGEEELGSHLTQCAHGRGLPACKFHLDPSNHLATIHQRYRQDSTDRQTDRQTTV